LFPIVNNGIEKNNKNNGFHSNSKFMRNNAICWNSKKKKKNIHYRHNTRHWNGMLNFIPTPMGVEELVLATIGTQVGI